MICTNDGSNEPFGARVFTKGVQNPTNPNFSPKCPFSCQINYLEKLSTPRDWRNMSTDHLNEIGVKESTGDVISDLERPQACENDMPQLTTIEKLQKYNEPS